MFRKRSTAIRTASSAPTEGMFADVPSRVREVFTEEAVVERGDAFGIEPPVSPLEARTIEGLLNIRRDISPDEEDLRLSLMLADGVNTTPRAVDPRNLALSAVWRSFRLG